MSAERFFILTPTTTNRTVAFDLGKGESFAVYLDASGNELKWSGKMPLPAIGQRVYMAINKIGYGKVEGYCDSHGFVGLLVKPENPPDWYKAQTKRNIEETKKAQKLGPEKAAIELLRVWPNWILEGIACVFGAEIREQE